MTVRLVGTCPVCERQQKVTPAGAMVHHGYIRPGTGSIHGDCFGVRWPAYELSPRGCEAYRTLLAEWRQSAINLLERYRARPETIDTERNFRGQIATYHRDSPDREKRLRYEQTLESAIRSAQYTIQEIERSNLRMAQLIQAWAPAPLVEIDEEGFTPAKREERAERKTERDTKRAEKEQKRHELQIKRNKRLAQRATQLLFFFDEFERIAALPPSKAQGVRYNYARDLIFELSKTKYNIRYPQDLWRGPEDGAGNHAAGPWGDEMVERASRVLVELGVGEPREHTSSGDFFRADPIPVYRSSGNKIRVPEPDAPAEEVLDAIARRAL